MRWPKSQGRTSGEESAFASPAYELILLGMAGGLTSRVGYLFGLAGNRVLSSRVADLAEDAAVRRALGEEVRRFAEFRCAAGSWPAPRRVIARIEASPQRSDTRFIVTNLEGAPRWLYESVYCARG